ncbi:hypothetical protein MFLAVUS_000066 [Mucor flavus]|uniref:Telomerase reverse transcriptase n=1 Tax=Mucor flavus TaxID=439312 RepID=A0ABP9YIN6_9FUNG
MSEVPDYFYRLFKSVQTLEDYLGDTIEQCKTSDLTTLLQTHLVIKSNRDCDNFSRWQKFVADKKLTLHCIEPKHFQELSNVLDRLVFYMNKDWKVNNALSSGVSIVSTFNVEVLSHKIENTVLNQMKDNEAWNAVLSCLGEESFCQLISTNLWLSEIQYKSAFLRDIESSKSSLSESNDNTTKIPRRIRKKLKMTKEKECETRKTESVDHIERSKMFFANTIVNSKTNKPLMALQRSHMFHPKQETGIRYAVSCTSEIFPKEFRNERKGKKFLKRFKQIPYLMELIHKRHSKTSSISILNKTCPTKTSAVNIVDAASTHKEVVNFIKTQLKEVFPISFWGSKHNLEAVQNVIYHFISKQKKDLLTMREVMYKFKVKECQWLEPPSKTDVCVSSDFKRREQVLYQMLNWLFRSYIIPVVKSMFYVTESAKNPNKLYLEHINSRSNTITDEKLYPRRQGSATVRLLPKDAGFRIITNMSSSTTDADSPNEILRPVFNVLQFEKEQNPELIGNSVLGKNIFYDRLKEYKSKLVDNEKLYFVKADIQNCFDTIDQKILLEILKDTLKSKDGYVNRKISAIRPFDNTLVKEDFDFSAPSKLWYLRVQPTRIAQMVPIHQQALQLKRKHFGSIIVDQNDYSLDSLEHIITLLEESIYKNTVKVGNDYYERNLGIPQGSNLSTLLCSFFLGKFEQDKLSFVKNDTTGILFTYVDDFLYITKNFGYAKWFLNAMIHETKTYGLKVNRKFPWLGYLLNTENLDVFSDIGKPKDIKSSVTTRFARNPANKLYVDCVINDYAHWKLYAAINTGWIVL